MIWKRKTEEKKSSESHEDKELRKLLGVESYRVYVDFEKQTGFHADELRPSEDGLLSLMFQRIKDLESRLDSFERSMRDEPLQDDGSGRADRKRRS